MKLQFFLKIKITKVLFLINILLHVPTDTHSIYTSGGTQYYCNLWQQMLMERRVSNHLPNLHLKETLGYNLTLTSLVTKRMLRNGSKPHRNPQEVQYNCISTYNRCCSGLIWGMWDCVKINWHLFVVLVFLNQRANKEIEKTYPYANLMCVCECVELYLYPSGSKNYYILLTVCNISSYSYATLVLQYLFYHN